VETKPKGDVTFELPDGTVLHAEIKLSKLMGSTGRVDGAVLAKLRERDGGDSLLADEAAEVIKSLLLRNAVLTEKLVARVGHLIAQLGRPDSREISVAPPKAAEQLVAFFAPAKQREQALGDLAEAHHANVALMGPRKAAWSYWYQVLASAAAFLWPRILGWAGIAAVLKRIGIS
jgi:hypothetical protein